MTRQPLTPEAQAKLASRLWRLRVSSWLLVPVVTLGLGTGLALLYMGAKARRRGWQLAGAGHLLAWVMALAGGPLLLLVWLGGVVHAVSVNREWLRFKAVDSTRPWWHEAASPAVAPWGRDAAAPGQVPLPPEVAGLAPDAGQFYGGRGAPVPPVSAPGLVPPPRPEARDRQAPPRPVDGQYQGHRAADSAPVEVNAATVAELAALPGMDTARAEAVVAARRARGRLDTAEEVAAAAGLAPHELVRLRDRLLFRPSPPAHRSGPRVVDC